MDGVWPHALVQRHDLTDVDCVTDRHRSRELEERDVESEDLHLQFSTLESQLLDVISPLSYKAMEVSSREKSVAAGVSRHMTTHDNKRKKECEDCGANFDNLTNLNYHRARRHRRWKYSCVDVYCGKKFSHMEYARKHARANHHVSSPEHFIQGNISPDEQSRASMITSRTAFKERSDENSLESSHNGQSSVPSSCDDSEPDGFSTTASQEASSSTSISGSGNGTSTESNYSANETSVVESVQEQVVDAIMQEFSPWWHRNLDLKFQTNGNQRDGDSSSSSHNNTGAKTFKKGEASPKNGRSNDNAPKRGRANASAEEEQEEDKDEEKLAPKRRRLVEDAGGEGRLLACPFFKRNPERYGCRDPCSKGGWRDTHRLKDDHLYKVHRLYKCIRCGDEFHTEEARKEHFRATEPCPNRPEKEYIWEKQGISDPQHLQLKSRAGNLRKASNAEKWNAIYKILFPDDDHDKLPSPYHHDGVEARLIMCRHERFLRQEVPHGVRKIVHRRFGQVLGPLHQKLLDDLQQLFKEVHSHFLGTQQQDPNPLVMPNVSVITTLTAESILGNIDVNTSVNQAMPVALEEENANEQPSDAVDVPEPFDWSQDLEALRNDSMSWLEVDEVGESDGFNSNDTWQHTYDFVSNTAGISWPSDEETPSMSVLRPNIMAPITTAHIGGVTVDPSLLNTRHWSVPELLHNNTTIHTQRGEAANMQEEKMGPTKRGKQKKTKT